MKKQIYKNVDGHPLHLWIYMPQNSAPSAGRTGIVFLHGGGWASGSPEYFGKGYNHFTALGAVCFGIEYRLIPAAYSVDDAVACTYLRNCIEDCSDAVAYIRANSSRYGIDFNKIVVCGESAGGHLALCFASSVVDYVNKNAKANAVIGMNPIPDLTGKWAECVTKIPEGTTEQQWRKRYENLKALSPLFHIHRFGVPVLLMHGLDDKVVEPAESLKFAEQYTAQGNQAQVKLYSGAKHAFMLPAYTNHAPSLQKGIEDMKDFLVKYSFL